MMMRWCNQKEEQQTVELIINYFLRVWMQNHSSVMETTVVHLDEIFLAKLMFNKSNIES